jgi:hypothetical protein
MKTAWYKEPWAWLVVLLPFSAVVAGISTLIIANTDADTLVVGEYYKKGKAINQDISKIKLAQKLGIKFQLHSENNQLVLTPTGIETKFPLLNVYFFHPTQADKDFTLTLTPNGKGEFRFDTSTISTGKWRITIMPFEKHWKIESLIYLPITTTVNIEPDPTLAN